jgi:TonB family protein
VPTELGPPLKANKSDLATLKNPETNKLVVRIDVDHGRITNISPVRSTGNPKLDSAAAQWVKDNWVFGPDQTGEFQLPVIFRKGGQRDEANRISSITFHDPIRLCALA